MLTIDDSVEFADLLDRNNIDTEREAWLIEAEVEISEEDARDGVRFWKHHYQ